ncbi:PREDICTED: uncharacterized protein LOC104075314 [Fulmarus glacialis]|uniref:uncharacterized protein LOC104075314 n=1 Tax=Fulmarus glacialis TaxID=30455 RepID=UPI00051C637C|nr:PREDICTED: uncharacterized protein LOC104075314 [Fulmarus glacialis]
MLHLKTLQEELGGVAGSGSIRTCNSRFLEKMLDTAVRGTNYFCMAIASIALLVYMPPRGMIAVFLDLAVMGKEFITTRLELTTSTVELTLSVDCPDQFWCTDEEYLPKMDERNKTLKEKLVSRLQFEPERAEVLLMAKGRSIVCEPADSSETDNRELSSSGERKYPMLCTAVYRASSERKHQAAIKEEDVCFGNVISRIHKEGREESVCQPTSYNIRETEMQTAVLKPSCHKKTCEQPKVERSSKKSLRTKVHSYDRTEPIDDDVIMHILRLRGKLGWQTKLPSCEWLAREADVARLQKFTLTRPLLLKDSGEYIYCLQRDRNNFKAPYNPYDLQAVSTNTAMQNKEYWTITASFVSKHVEDNEEPRDEHKKVGLRHSQSLPEVPRDLLRMTADIRKETSAQQVTNQHLLPVALSVGPPWYRSRQA